MVSLFLKKILDGVQEKHGLPKPDIKFVASGQHDNKETFGAIKGLLEKIAATRTLLVTEFISSGRSIKKLTNILEDLNLKFDVAALSSERKMGGLTTNPFARKPDTQFYLGSKDNIGLNFFRKNMSGVAKSEESQSPFPEKKISTHSTEEHKEEVQREINQAREDIGALARETLKELGI